MIVGDGGMLSNSTSPSSRPLDPDDVVTFQFKPTKPTQPLESSSSISLPPITSSATTATSAAAGKSNSISFIGGGATTTARNTTNTSRMYSTLKPQNVRKGTLSPISSSSNHASSARSNSIVSILPHQKLNSAAMASVSARAAHDQKVCVFDVNSGNIFISNNRDVDRNRLVAKLYQQMQNNESLKKQFSQVAGQLPLSRRKELANETLERFHQNKQKAMLARKMLPDAVSRHRANILKHLEIDRCFGDLSKDTSELAAVRISSAAVDALLFHEALKVADAQLKQQRSLILPEGVRPVDVLEMRLDAWRRQNVPFGVRSLVS